MTLKIDISENEYKAFRAMGALAYVFVIFFAGAGLFILFEAYYHKDEWRSYFNGLSPLLLAVIIYLQATGKLPRKKYIYLETEKLEYRTKPFSTTSLLWTNIRKVDFEYTSIKFSLNSGQIKRFDLMNVTIFQIKELKENLKDICLQHQIEFSSK